LAIIEYRLNNPDQAKVEMAKLIAKFGDNSLYQQAQILAQWGDLSAALELLEKAYQMGDSGMALLRNDPLLDKLRKQVRFIKLMTDMGFE
jgi:predicted Zn-dependent protease